MWELVISPSGHSFKPSQRSFPLRICVFLSLTNMYVVSFCCFLFFCLYLERGIKAWGQKWRNVLWPVVFNKTCFNLIAFLKPILSKERFWEYLAIIFTEKSTWRRTLNTTSSFCTDDWKGFGKPMTWEPEWKLDSKLEVCMYFCIKNFGIIFMNNTTHLATHQKITIQFPNSAHYFESGLYDQFVWSKDQKGDTWKRSEIGMPTCIDTVAFS